MTRPSDIGDVLAAAELRLGCKLPSDHIAYFWEFSEEGTAVCVLKYYEQVGDGFAHPGNEETVVLERCLIGDDDIASFLSPYYRKRIEGLALAELQSGRRKRECEEFDAEVA